jgi:hypothetical protein
MSNEDSPTPPSNDPKAERAARWVPLGEIYITANAHAQLPMSAILIGIARHASGDWGDLPEDDWNANDEALQVGERLLSAYQTAGGVKFWIITEWDRSITTILLPDDY